MTTHLFNIAALLMVGAVLAASPAVAAGAVPGNRGPGDRPIDRDAPLTLPGPVRAGATPHVDRASLSRGIFGEDAVAALDSLGTVTLSRDGSTAETPASDALRGVFETSMAGRKI